MAYITTSFGANLFLALLSGCSLVTCFPNFHYSIIIWVGLLPLFIAIRDKSMKVSFTLCFICGVAFFTGIFRWVLNFPGFTLLHQAILGAYVGIFFGLFGLAFSLISKRRGIIAALLSAPFMWVSLEFIRSNLSFLALPWGVLAYSQYHNPSLIQIVSITGVYGLSFLIVFVNVAIAAVVFHLVHRGDKRQSLHLLPSSGKTRALVFTVCLLVAMTLLYGQIADSRPYEGKAVKTSVIQGNIDQSKKWDPKHAHFIMDTYSNLTQRASVDTPRLIVWPETATPGAINEDLWFFAEVVITARRANAHLLLGSAQRRKFEAEGEPKREYMNSAFLIDPWSKTGIHQRYDKIRLIPFGEYTPLKGIVPWSCMKVPMVAGFVPGKKFTVFEHPDFRFSVAICWETVFPDLVGQFVKNGAQFMVNISNEAWFGRTAAPYQFLAMNIFRAVENRVYLVRCANTGVSCFIDPYGRIVDRVKDKNGRDIFVRGVLTGTVIPSDYKTIYTRYGDWFAWLCILCSVGFVLVAIFKKNPDQRLMDRPHS